MRPRRPRSTLFPYTTLFRSLHGIIPAHFGQRISKTSQQDSQDEVLKILRSEEHTSELQSLRHLVCRLLLEKKKYIAKDTWTKRMHPGEAAQSDITAAKLTRR